MTTTTESQPTTDNLSTPMEEFILNRVFDKTDPSPDAETIAKRNVGLEHPYDPPVGWVPPRPPCSATPPHSGPPTPTTGGPRPPTREATPMPCPNRTPYCDGPCAPTCEQTNDAVYARLRKIADMNRARGLARLNLLGAGSIETMALWSTVLAVHEFTNTLATDPDQPTTNGQAAEALRTILHNGLSEGGNR